jgi:hypothetical protein
MTNPAHARTLALSFKRQGMIETYAALMRVADNMEEGK